MRNAAPAGKGGETRGDVLTVDTGWRIGEAALRAIVENLRSLSPRRMVEFGSGASTVRLAQAFPGASLLSVEHDPSYARETRALKEARVPHAAVEVDLHPLVWQRHGLLWYVSYATGAFPDAIDAVIIDGPPTALTRRGREACLHQVLPRLRRGGRVFLHDAERAEERRIVRNWLATYPGAFRATAVAVDRGLAVLEKRADVPRRMRPAVVGDTAATALGLLCGGRRPARTHHAPR